MIAVTDLDAAVRVYRFVVIGGNVAGMTFGVPGLVIAAYITGVLLGLRIHREMAT